MTKIKKMENSVKNLEKLKLSCTANMNINRTITLENCIIFFLFFFLMAVPKEYGSSQGRG